MNNVSRITLAMFTVAAWVAIPTFGLAQNGKKEMNQESVLLKEWIGPYGGVPPWRQVNPDEFIGAFDEAIKLAKVEIEKIANNPIPPTFENTVVALERVGESLDRVQTIFGVHASNLNVGSIPDIETAVGPKLSKFSDSTTQNEKLFKRIEAVFNDQPLNNYSVAEKRLIKDRYESFVRQGAKLDAKQKARLSEINAQLAGLFAKFSQAVLNDEGSYVTFINDKAKLTGLPQSTIDAMASAAQEADGDNKGKWAITNTRSSMEPFLTYAEDRALREQVWRRYYARGDNGGEFDTNETITAILKLRAERAILLGYKTHAHWRLEPQMAKTPEQAMDLMMKVWPKAVARVKEEVADMQKVADDAGAGITIEPWDYRFYAEKVRKAKYDLDF
ncbi:MAG: M3 family metallopeptidase, partial [Mariniblastus sp.]|nr:M3 family metallopeptidase [Mariniblastus sp.]